MFSGGTTDYVKKGLPKEWLRPLTIIDMDSFIFNHDAFKDKKTTLGGVIDGCYHQLVHLPRRKPEGDMKAASQMLNNKSIGFPAYLIRVLKSRGLYKVPEMIYHKGKSLFQLFFLKSSSATCIFFS